MFIAGPLQLVGSIRQRFSASLSWLQSTDPGKTRSPSVCRAASRPVGGQGGGGRSLAAGSRLLGGGDTFPGGGPYIRRHWRAREAKSSGNPRASSLARALACETPLEDRQHSTLLNVKPYQIPLSSGLATSVFVFVNIHALTHLMYIQRNARCSASTTAGA